MDIDEFPTEEDCVYYIRTHLSFPVGVTHSESTRYIKRDYFERRKVPMRTAIGKLTESA